MNVEFENKGYVKITFFSASFNYYIPVCSDADIEVWRRFVSDDIPSISISSSHLMTLPPNTHDVELIRKEYDAVIFKSPVSCFPENFQAGGETRIPFVYCKEAFNKVLEYLDERLI